MKLVLIILSTIVAVVVVLTAVAFVIGALLPKGHVAAVAARYAAPPERVYDAIADVASGTKWRTGLKEVRITSSPNEVLRWTETADWGTLNFVREEERPPARIVSRIADTSQGFGGTWVYEVSPDGTGSTLRITENGEVYSPLFRFMSRFVFGHYRTLETYARDLGRHLGEAVEPTRVSS